MFTLWLDEPWVRNLVLLLTPVGFIDATFTVFLFRSIGAEFEYNPFVRGVLQSEWWGVWFLIDAISFFLFIMMAGSYYLHTRNSLVNNRINLVSGLVALRVGLAAHNVIRFFGLFPGVLGGIMIGLITFIIMDSLLDRTSDVSWEGFKQWWKHKADRYHDSRLIKRAQKKDVGEATKLDDEIEVKSEVEQPVGIESGSVWRKRALYIFSALALFIIMPYFLVFIGDLTGATSFTDIYGPMVFWNELSAPAFLLGFVAICVFTAGIMYLVLRSFEITEGAW